MWEGSFLPDSGVLLSSSQTDLNAWLKLLSTNYHNGICYEDNMVRGEGKGKNRSTYPTCVNSVVKSSLIVTPAVIHMIC